ncbi:MAG: hypothetical protein KDB21_04130 [Acidimicrobiales bacterium]|nr:hypothetical protein [Acidimicrobiales bacterium]
MNSLRGRRRRTVASLLVALALIAGACGDDDDTAAGDDTTAGDTTPSPAGTPGGDGTDTGDSADSPTVTPVPAAPTATPGSADEPTPTVAAGDATPTPTPAADCAAPLPDGRLEESLGAADVDGDGQPDTVLVYSLGPIDDPASWYLRVELAGGGALATAIQPDGGVVIPPRAMDGFDIQGDGNDEVWAAVGAGASARIIAIWAVDGCDLRQLEYDGSPATFAIGATVGTTSGLECRDFDANGFNDAIVPWTGFSNDGIVYDVEGPVLTLSGSTLTLLETDATSVDITSGADTTAYSGLACGDLILP